MPESLTRSKHSSLLQKFVNYDRKKLYSIGSSSEWGHIRCLVDGLNLADVEAGNYGTHLNVFDWTSRKLIQKIDLGIEGVAGLKVLINQVDFFYKTMKCLYREH